MCDKSWTYLFDTHHNFINLLRQNQYKKRLIELNPMFSTYFLSKKQVEAII